MSVTTRETNPGGEVQVLRAEALSRYPHR
jgi:hypothetical protein